MCRIHNHSLLLTVVEKSTGKGRLILKDFIVAGEEGNNSGKAELVAE